MNAFDDILGHQRALDALRRMIERERVPHALLFEGPDGVGKAMIAARFAGALLCRRDESPCGCCDDCRLQRQGHHPDALNVTLLPKPDSPKELRKSIIIEQIRELSHLAALGPRMARRRVFVIDPADRMMPQAQNALLKTLEEPPGNAVLVLCAARPALLLPTVHSRCFTVAFSPLRTAELAELLAARGIDGDEAAVRAALGEGRPGRALALDVELLRDRRDRVLRAIEAMSGGPQGVAALPDAARALAGDGEDDLIESLELVQVLLRDAARAIEDGGGAELVHRDLAARLVGVGRRLGPTRAAELIGYADRLRGDLRFNVNRLLVAESLLAAVAGAPPC